MSGNLDHELKLVEQEYGIDHLDLVLATGYLWHLIENVRTVHHLAKAHPECWPTFRDRTASGGSLTPRPGGLLKKDCGRLKPIMFGDWGC